MTDLEAVRDLKAATALVAAYMCDADEDIETILGLCDPGAVARILALTLVNLLHAAGDEPGRLPAVTAEHLQRVRSGLVN